MHAFLTSQETLEISRTSRLTELFLKYNYKSELKSHEKLSTVNGVYFITDTEWIFTLC